MSIRNKQKLCVLQASYEESTSVIKDLDYQRDLSQWIDFDNWEVEYLLLKKATIVKQLIQSKADLYLNLCGKN